jgi:endoglycosylceramidase
MQEWGFNFMRLGVMWPGVEPTPGQYNATYLSAIQELVERAGQYGIFTLLDFHQDLLHPSLCGEGLPSAYLRVTSTACNETLVEKLARKAGLCKSMSEFNLTVDPATGYPTLASCLQHPFGLFYPTPEVSTAFQSLYTEADLQRALAAYWQVVVKSVTSPYAFAVDLLNEPWAGDVWAHPEQMIPGHADKELLQPLFAALHAAIREVGDDKVVMFEETQVPDVLPVAGGIVSPIGFTQSPGGSADANQALSYHVYCCVQSGSACNISGDPVNPPGCVPFNTKKTTTRTADATRLGVGAMITEFGACSNTQSCADEIGLVTRLADSNLQGWAYWGFKYFGDVTTSGGPAEGLFNGDGSVQTLKVAALTRTYARAVQGTPTAMSFDPESGAFRLDYVADPTITAPTEIYLNAAFHYPSGLTYTPASAVLSGNTLTVPPTSGPVTVTISRK